jgi:hypothetical protein
MTDIDFSRAILRPAAAHGWLRRPDLDTATAEAWEAPDGRMYGVAKGTTPVLASFPGAPRCP